MQKKSICEVKRQFKFFWLEFVRQQIIIVVKSESLHEVYEVHYFRKNSIVKNDSL